MEPELKLYTIKDLREWLINNNPPAGLSEHVIAPVRAYAILNNPYVKDDDAIVAAIYEYGELAAFTACFPEIINYKSPITKCGSNRIWWASTLWCNPKFQGKGYGLIVIGSLMEAHEEEITLDRWGAQETVEIFKCLGYETIYTSRYHFCDKAINRNTMKGKLAYFAQEFKKSLYSTFYTLHSTSYTLKYSTFIDGEMYAFMQAHRGSDLFLREQAMLNWILRYPFMQYCPLKDNVTKDCEFSSNTKLYGYILVKVYSNNYLVGIYILRRIGDSMEAKYLYYVDDYEQEVFTSIVDHIRVFKVNNFGTENKSLAEFVIKQVYFPKSYVEPVSFSVPQSMSLLDSYTMQYGDGDSFV